MKERNLSKQCGKEHFVRRSSLRASKSHASTVTGSVGRSVSFCDQEVEVHTVEKIARKKKDKETLWFTSSEYDIIRIEAQLLIATFHSFDKINDHENTYRGLEPMKAGEQARVEAARQFVLDRNEQMYSFFASTAVRKAQHLALQDAKEAAEYQRELPNEQARSRSYSKKGFLKFLSQRPQ